jgi:uncharacterized membrane-anchored protein YhcB (DUF1043 family)
VTTSAAPDEKQSRITWLHSSWPQLLLFLVVQIGGLLWFMRGVADDQHQQIALQTEFNTEFKGQMSQLNLSMRAMSEQVANLATSYARIDEHMKGIEQRVNTHDHRIDKIEEWKR